MAWWVCTTHPVTHSPVEGAPRARTAHSNPRTRGIHTRHRMHRPPPLACAKIVENLRRLPSLRPVTKRWSTHGNHRPAHAGRRTHPRRLPPRSPHPPAPPVSQVHPARQAPSSRPRTYGPASTRGGLACGGDRDPRLVDARHHPGGPARLHRHLRVPRGLRGPGRGLRGTRNRPCSARARKAQAHRRSSNRINFRGKQRSPFSATEQ